MTAVVIHLSPRRPRRTVLDNARAAEQIAAAVAGLNRALLELAGCGCRTLTTEDGTRYLDHYGPELHERNDVP